MLLSQILIRIGCFVGLAALSAPAAVTVRFPRGVTSVDPALAGVFTTAQTISGSLTIDDSVIDDQPDVSNRGNIPGAVASFSAVIGREKLHPCGFGLVSPGTVYQWDFEAPAFLFAFRCVAEGSGKCGPDAVMSGSTPFTVVPEPSSLSLLGLVLVAVRLAMRKGQFAGRPTSRHPARKSWLSASLLRITGMLFALSLSANAALVTYNFSGSFSSVNPLLNGVVSAAQTISGSFTVDDSIADTETFVANVGEFPGALVSLSATITGGGLPDYPLMLASSSTVRQRNNSSTFIFGDHFVLESFSLNAPNVSGIVATGIIIDLADESANRYTTNAQAKTLAPLPDLRLFGSSALVIVFCTQSAGCEESGEAAMQGTIDSLSGPSASEVPEPSSFQLLALGIAGMVLAAMRLRRS